jgi:hypothetical protein
MKSILSNKNKLGVSIMIGYVLLVAGGIAMGFLVYNWMKTYIPVEKPDCPEGVSIYINQVNCTGNLLNISLRNNGRFNITGYIIRGANDSNAQIATIDLSEYYKEPESNGQKLSESIVFNNSLAPEENINEIFNLSEGFEGDLKFIEIIPRRDTIIKNRRTTQTCTNSKVKAGVLCS